MNIQVYLSALFDRYQHDINDSSALFDIYQHDINDLWLKFKGGTSINVLVFLTDVTFKASPIPTPKASSWFSS